MPEGKRGHCDRRLSGDADVQLLCFYSNTNVNVNSKCKCSRTRLHRGGKFNHGAVTLEAWLHTAHKEGCGIAHVCVYVCVYD